MPLLTESDYQPPLFLFNGHLQMIWANLCRQVPEVAYQRERIDTPDGDFLDLDWACIDAEKLVLLSHGLEGHSQRPYTLGMAAALKRRGWDVLAWNFRGCSGVPNRLPRFYHSGDSADLSVVVDHVLQRCTYRVICLVGFSLGANLTLKYLGEGGEQLDERIKCGVAFSVPCHLASGAARLNAWENTLYLRRFMQQLRHKVEAKVRLRPGELDVEGLGALRTFQQFDDRYTAPLHGFKDADDYWHKSSSKAYLGAIRVPTLIVNARNDSFLAPECYPVEEAEGSEFVYLERPQQGGHVGFPLMGEEYWSEKRVVEFFRVHNL